MDELAKLAVALTGDNEALYDSFDESESRAKSWGTKLGNTINLAIVAAVALAATAVIGAIVSIGAVAIDTANQFQSANNMMQTQLGLTEEEAANLGQVVEGVFVNNFGENIDDVAQSLVTVRQNMDRFGLMTNAQLQGATETAIALRDAFEIDVAQSTNAAGVLMENFGLTAEEAFLFIQSGMERGLNKSEDFLETIGEYSNQFAAGGADAGQFFSMLESGLQGGLLGTDKAADLFKEFRVRIQDGSEGVSDALNTIGIDADALLEGMANGSISAIDAFHEIKTALSRVDDEAVQFQAGVALMGTQFEDLGADAVFGLEFIDSALSDVTDGVGDLNAQYNDLPTAIEGFKRRALVALKPVGDALLGLANRIMPHVERGFVIFDKFVVPIIQRVAKNITIFADAFIGGLEDGVKPIEALRSALAKVVPPELMDQLNPVIDGMLELVDKSVLFVSTHSEELKAALIAIGGVLAAAAIASGILAIAGAIASLFNPITLVLVAVGTLAAAWQGNWGGIQEKTIAVLDAIMPYLQRLGDWIAQTALPELQKLGEMIMTFVVPGFTQLAIWAMQVAQAVLPVLAGAIGFVIDNFELFKPVLIGVGLIVLALTAPFLIIAATVVAFAAAYNQNWLMIRDITDQVAANIREKIDTVRNVLHLLSVFVTDILVPTWRGNLLQIVEIWNLAWQAVLTIFEINKNLVLGAVTSLITTIVLRFGDTEWFAIGTAIIQGVANGISAGTRFVIDAATRAIQSAVDAARNLIDAHSPSRLLAAEVGVPMGQGVAMGFGQATKNADFSGDLRSAIDRIEAPEPSSGNGGPVNQFFLPAGAGAADEVFLTNLIRKILLETGQTGTINFRTN